MLPCATIFIYLKGPPPQRSIKETPHVPLPLKIERAVRMPSVRPFHMEFEVVFTKLTNVCISIECLSFWNSKHN